MRSAKQGGGDGDRKVRRAECEVVSAKRVKCKVGEAGSMKSNNCAKWEAISAKWGVESADREVVGDK